MENLLKECVRMQALDHPNVLKLSGVCLDGGPAPYIIMPFMANGSLLNYLQDNREYLVVDSRSENVVNFGDAWSIGGYWGRVWTGQSSLITELDKPAGTMGRRKPYLTNLWSKAFGSLSSSLKSVSGL